MVLFIKHIPIEGSETIGAFFARRGISCRDVDLSKGDSLPDSLDGIEAVVSLGGPMNVYEEDKYPFLRDENIFIQKILKAEIPFLGICLGSQLLAKACGAKVTKSPQKEIGFDQIQLSREGKEDPLFAGLDEEIDVYQWHEDMWRVPKNGILLAMGKGCPHQAFKVGPCAYGFQFHIEITDKSIREWSDEYFSPDDRAGQKKKAAMLKQYSKKQPEFLAAAERIYLNFFHLMAKQHPTAGVPKK